MKKASSELCRTWGHNQFLNKERKHDFVQKREIERLGKTNAGIFVVSVVTSGLALHRVMKPFNWSRAAFGRDAENDMFNSDPLQCGEH